MTKMAAKPIYGKNLKKIMTLKAWMTLTSFTARSTWVTNAFEWGKLVKFN